MSDEKRIRGGFSYYVSDEQLEFYRHLPIGERLRWLEEAQEFMFKILPKEKWDLMQRFRRGEI